MNVSTQICSFVALITLLVGCSSYRGAGEYGTRVGKYKGLENYKTSSNYSSNNARKNNRSRSWRPSGEFSLTWPVKTIKVSQKFRPRSNRSHEGLDLRGSYDSKILAAHEGVVVYAGQGYRGYGKMIIIEYDNKWASLYAHLSRLYVEQGQVVGHGEALGLMGATGRASGVHLHFELLYDKQPIDPLPSLKRSHPMAQR